MTITMFNSSCTHFSFSFFIPWELFPFILFSSFSFLFGGGEAGVGEGVGRLGAEVKLSNLQANLPSMPEALQFLWLLHLKPDFIKMNKFCQMLAPKA